MPYFERSMKSFFLFLFGLISIEGLAQSSFTYPSLVVEYDSAILFKNLKLIPIKRSMPGMNDSNFNKQAWITLQQGLQKGSVKIKERGNYMVDNINVLLIQNTGRQNLVLKSGDMITGGRQDRVIAKDTILAPGNQQYTIPVYCIEENRWSNHEKKFEYKGSAGAGLQKIIDSAHNQTKLWDEIRKLLKENNQTSSSYAAVLTNKKIVDSSNFYIRYFLQQFSKKDSSIVGLIASTGNHILGADVFLNAELFYQTLSSLLIKYSTEAVLHGTPVTEYNHKEKKYADEMLSPSTQQPFILKRGKMIYYKGKLIQLTGYSFHQ
jgi:hypothetical protein